ncbi:histidine phosphatase family protein [uncultured Acetobacteroides sp.]|uniref:SixA phosphatase family protein n=1 Tax=uncultured Acetobacteroides sp. TaxID=1760811 RepID=UPI0029F45CC6|nr:histidine phosphatase family protein [uncultured Acetobacteroides sp.]
MKMLYILRHAKASSDAEYADIDRPLKPSGIRDAYILGNELEHRKLQVDYIAVSNATRALQTASIVARAAELPFETLRVIPNLYLSSYSETLAYIRQLPDNAASVMLVGHNPELSYLCEKLLNENHLELPTCGFMAFSVTADSWSEVSSTNTKEEFHIFPK